MQPDTSITPPAPAPARRRPRYVRLAAALGGLALVAGAVWWWTHRAGSAADAGPQPPDVNLTGVDPTVADTIRKATQRLRHDLRSGTAWGRLGKVLLAHAFNAEALVCLRRAEELDPRDPRWPYLQGLALARQDGDAALAHFRRAVGCLDKGNPGPTAPRLRLAEVLMARGLDDEAAAQFRAVARLEPDNPRLLYDSALLACKRNDFPEARNYLLRLTDSPFARQKAYAALAMVSLRLGESARAEEYDRKGRQTPEDAPWADPYMDSFTHLEVGRQARLREVEHLELGQEHARAVGLLQDRRRQKVTGADGELESIALGSNLAKLGRFEEAAQVLHDALRKAPDTARIHYTLAMVYFVHAEVLSRSDRPADRARAEANYRQSIASARRATELRSDSPLAELLVGRALHRLHRPAEAIETVRRVVRSRPDLPVPHLYLGRYLAEANQDAEALAEFELAVRVGPPGDPVMAADLEAHRAKMAARGKLPAKGAPR